MSGRRPRQWNSAVPGYVAACAVSRTDDLRCWAWLWGCDGFSKFIHFSQTVLFGKKSDVRATLSKELMLWLLWEDRQFFAVVWGSGGQCPLPYSLTYSVLGSHGMNAWALIL